MKYLLITLLVLGLIGCESAFNKVTKTEHIQESKQEATKATIKGGVNITYPEAPQITITASGNSSPQVTIGAPGMIRASKVEDKSVSESTDSNFSLDRMVESVPQWAWPCIIIGLALLLGVYIIWTKTTATGRASDSFIAGRIKTADIAISSMTEALIQLDPKTDTFRTIQSKLDTLKDERANQLAKTRGK